MKKMRIFLSAIILALTFAIAIPVMASEDEGKDFAVHVWVGWYEDVLVQLYDGDEVLLTYALTDQMGEAVLRGTVAEFPSSFTLRVIAEGFEEMIVPVTGFISMGTGPTTSVWVTFIDVQLVPARIQPTPMPTPPPAPNLDTASGWAHEGISQAVAMGIVPAQLQNNYNQAITRAEFAALAVTFFEASSRYRRYPDRREIRGRVTFDDTNDVNVEKAAYVGLISGVGGNRFNPDGLITREQAAVLISRLANHDGFPFFGWFNDFFDQEMSTFEPTFADNDTLSAWAVDGVGHMQTWEIMGGVGGNRFNPRGTYTREQSIITFLRLAEYLSVMHIPYGVTTIPGWELQHHPFLETIIIPSSVNLIEEHAFHNIPTLRHVFIHSMDIYIQGAAFWAGWDLDFSLMGSTGNVTVYGYRGSGVEEWFSHRDYYREHNFTLMD